MHSYKKPLLYVTGLNVLFFIIFHSYYECYEGLISTLVSGTYTVPCLGDWNNDLQFLLLPVYAWINRFFPFTQVYGLSLYIINVCAISMMGVLLFKTLKIYARKYHLPLFILLYSAVSIDNLMNLSSDRIAFFLAVDLFWYMEYYRSQNDSVKYHIAVGELLLLLIACLIRFEVVLLCSLFYLVTLAIFRQIHRYAFLPFLVSAVFFFSFNIITSHISDEPKKVAFYKEKQFFDREDIDTARLVSSQLLTVKAFNTYQLMDKEHFTLNFYNSISRYGHTKKTFFSLWDGISIGSSIGLFLTTVVECNKIWFLVLFFIILSVYAISRNSGNRKLKLWFFFFLLFPMMLSFYVFIPLRFLTPYYSILCVILVLMCLRFNLVSYRVLLIALSALLIFVIKNSLYTKSAFRRNEYDYKTTLGKIHSVIKEKNTDKPVIISNIDYGRYFPASPFTCVAPENMRFLNFYFFACYKCYRDSWKNLCGCDPHSLKEKIDYIIVHQNYFIIDQPTLFFLDEYFASKYHQHIIYKKIARIDQKGDMYLLTYGKKSGV